MTFTQIVIYFHELTPHLGGKGVGVGSGKKAGEWQSDATRREEEQSRARKDVAGEARRGAARCGAERKRRASGTNGPSTSLAE